MDELLIRIMVRLVRVHEELGDRPFEDAAHRALVGIATAVQVEANRRAGAADLHRHGDIVRFPLGRRTMVPPPPVGDDAG